MPKDDNRTKTIRKTFSLTPDAVEMLTDLASLERMQNESAAVEAAIRARHATVMTNRQLRKQIKDQVHTA